MGLSCRVYQKGRYDKKISDKMIDGILVVNKPTGISSAGVVARVKKILKAKRVGHTGTLDPFATGILICCLNRATRLASLLVQGKKRYEAVLRLGVRTDTQDLTGEVISVERNISFKESEIYSAFERFRGKILQTPPPFSALKHRGVPLYKLARKGSYVEKPPRTVFIYESNILEIALPDIRFEVLCSHGTYVRALCADIGDALGCGGHLAGLCRTENAGFTLKDSSTLEEIEELASKDRIEERIINMGDALKEVSAVFANEWLAQKIRHGQPIFKRELNIKDGIDHLWIKIVDSDNNLIAVLDRDTRRGACYKYVCVFPDIMNKKKGGFKSGLGRK
nr:tRNA pseudouridine(55) synthase TruB [Desulfobacterales bacterium]